MGINPPAIVSGGLTDIGYEKWPKNAGQAPGSKHQAVDRPDPFRPKVIRSEGRHCAEAAAVTADYDKAHQSKHSELAERRQQEKKRRLEQEHDQENIPAPNRIGGPGPKQSTNAVTDGNDTYHACADRGAHAADLLRHRRSL